MTRKASKTVIGQCKELTELSLNEIWWKAEVHVVWRKRVSFVAPNGLNCLWDSILSRRYIVFNASKQSLH